jgi:triphosphoribosyl-dephospho-CoA synthase
VTGFGDVFDVGLVAVEAALVRGEAGIWPAIFAYMAFLSGFPDSHVTRNHGANVANRTRHEAIAVRAELDACAAESSRIHLLMEFDRQLKARGVNPGTSADLTVTSLLVHSLGVQLA